MTPPRPHGPLSFDWVVGVQIQPEIDDPDPDWPDVFGRIRVPVLVIRGGPGSFVPEGAR